MTAPFGEKQRYAPGVDRSGKATHRTDRCGKVSMVRLCTGCGSVQWGAACDGCGLKLDGYRAENVRQGGVRHIKALLATMRAAGEISEDAEAKLIAGMLGLEG